ncbi:putative PKS/NRPS-like protein biosynthetic cluster [Lepraria neglecta]|uniref:PKS/NRPS-like protein biosynthetic cluster n=1 Tax=Lepraria neglecta TaxID=209136 RepID=A0AAD9ZAE3_9LECA|nr:putative PKS/NRPS-like protein biosynthetic cluster [Lepraria neglecta]
MAECSPIPIAIIGIGCRLPGGVSDTEGLWDLLANGKNTWSPVPSERFNEDAFYHPNPENNGTTNHRGGHFLSQDNDLAAFDAGFFGMSAAEAQATDPQQRLLLEASYEAFENAGIPIDQVRGSDTAVYTAMFTRDYDRNIYKDPIEIPKYHATGCGEAILSNRISYFFHLNGPSMTLDTGCSGSMVALHQACQSLRAGESSAALACGVSLILNPDHMIAMSKLYMLNDNGRSYPFDARGAGYGRGEGVTAVVLKRLDDALNAGDSIRAVIRNTSVNHDGKTKGITLPSAKAQETLQRTTYQQAGLDPCTVQYMEAHGTGTAAGDVAELQGIAQAFCKNRPPSNPLYIGSIKSNIGHLESSSGLAGLIKTVLMLERGYLLPNADFQEPKSELELDKWNMRVSGNVSQPPNRL